MLFPSVLDGSNPLAVGRRNGYKYLAQRQRPFELRYNPVMAKSSSRDKMTVRIIRGGQDEALDDSWLNSSPEERVRVEAVWTLVWLHYALI